MTIINDIEIDNITYTRNQIKESIVNNDTIEDKLHVVIVISNPCLFARRYILIREFIKRIEMEETDVLLYVVEMAYGNQKFIITDAKNSRHLQVRTPTPLWHKENMINLGIRYLLPKNWKAVAWIDADLEFENTTWAKDTLKVLNGSKDVVQLFSHCVDMDINDNTMNIFTSFGHQYVKGRPYLAKLMDYWHPGYAWACTRQAYDKMGGLYEKAILGSGDNIMALSYIGKGLCSVNENSSEDYKKTILDFQERVKFLRLGYVPGVIRHYFHGTKKNRKYTERWQILLKYDFAPSSHITVDKRGVIIPTDSCPNELFDDIYVYFKERNEDEFFHEKLNIKPAVNYVEDKENIVKLDETNVITILQVDNVGNPKETIEIYSQTKPTTPEPTPEPTLKSQNSILLQLFPKVNNSNNDSIPISPNSKVNNGINDSIPIPPSSKVNNINTLSITLPPNSKINTHKNPANSLLIQRKHNIPSPILNSIHHKKPFTPSQNILLKTNEQFGIGPQEYTSSNTHKYYHKKTNNSTYIPPLPITNINNKIKHKDETIFNKISKFFKC